MKRDCPDKKSTGNAMLCTEERQKVGGRTKIRIHRQGVVEGQEVQDILLDTCCSRTMVHKNLVPPEKILEEDVVTIGCAHGDLVLYPLADVEHGLPIRVEAAISEKLSVAVLLGKDVPDFDDLLGIEGTSDESVEKQDKALVVVTHAQACRQLEDEIFRREEMLSGAQPSPVDEELGESGTKTGPKSESTKVVETT